MKKLKNNLILSTIAITFFFGLGSKLNLFEKLIWYDEFLHFLGGVWVGLTFIWIINQSYTPKKIISGFEKKPIRSILIFVLIISIIWESFEFGLTQYILKTFQYKSGLQPSLLDTFSDLLMNFLGSITAFTLFKKTNTKN
ncbi:MAG TPA: hypothetical protein VKO61_01020 [Candidatus Paceibacterota bacterium]|nr:hypothetical protein [Candidatus Paceibacterota bacterium]